MDANKNRRWLRRTAVLTFALPVALVLLHSLLIWLAGRVFPVAGDAAVWQTRVRLREVRELIGGLAQVTALAGSLALAVQVHRLRPRPPVLLCLGYGLAFVAACLLCSAPFALTDSLYALADYALPLMAVAWPMVLALLYRLALAAMDWRRKGK